MTEKYSVHHLPEKLLSWREEEILKKIFEKGVTQGHAVALWKLPDQPEKQAIIDLSPDKEKVAGDLQKLPQGFIMAPFDNPGNTRNTFIKADLYLRINPEATEKIKIVDNSGLDYFHKLFNGRSERAARVAPFFPGQDTTARETGKKQYIEVVKEAVRQILRGGLQKVVPSKIKIIDTPDDLDIIAIFQHMCSVYPNAFISLVTIPGEGTWLGATPETLISIDDQNIFRTVALAGTQQLAMGQPAGTARWSQKEIEEQALVSRYIINCFKYIRLREFEEKGPKTVAAGNLAHLKTEYAVDMDAVNFPRLGTIMLNLLHPTSAVCGMPKGPALDFISAHENFDRSFYSGFLGPVNIHAESHLFVNLRCMQLLNKKALLYAGAGITEDSDPEKEWEETELKCQTLLDVILRQKSA